MIKQKPVKSEKIKIECAHHREELEKEDKMIKISKFLIYLPFLCILCIWSTGCKKSSEMDSQAEPDYAPVSDVGKTYTLNTGGETALTAYIYNENTMHTYIDDVTIVSYYSYKKAGKNTAEAVFYWNYPFVVWETRLTFTSYNGGTFVITNWDNERGTFTIR